MAGQDGGSSRPPLSAGKAGMPLGIAALAALLYSLSSGTAVRPGNAGEDKKETAEAASQSRSPLQPLYEFLDVQAGAGNKGPCGSLAQYRVDFIIATVPDPIDSHLSPSFDRAVDAIQRGLQSTGLTLDRFWMPWKREGEARWELSLSDSKPTVSAKVVPSNSHREVPGTLLFRDSAAQRLTVVFLVGEVPTWGVQRRALTNALEEIAKTETPDAAHPCLAAETRSIKVLGPYFSGSTESLKNSLVVWNQAHRPIEIISGSATVDSNATTLSGSELTFRATVVPDLLLTHHFLEFLGEHLGAARHDLALFVEGGTSYGSANVNFTAPQTREERDQLCSAVATAPAPKTDLEKLRGNLRPRFTVDFPLHVAQLRAAYEKDEALRAGAAQNRGPRRNLELALESNEHGSRDIVYPQDGVAAAGTADLTLGDSIETIRREKIRFVGIIGSDPRDILFLARKIREAGSDATLFTYGADILFTHPDYTRFLRGMLVVTPYPLFPGNQALTRTRWRRVSFAGFSEEGVYNAIRYFAGQKARLLDYRAPGLGPENLNPSRPPIWVMVVGRESLWPVAINATYWDVNDPSAELARDYVLESCRIAPSAKASERNPDPSAPRPPGSSIALVVVEVILAALAAAYWLVRREAGAMSPAQSRVPELLLRWFTVWTDPDAKRVNCAYLACLMLIAAATQATITIALLSTRRLMGEAFVTKTLGLGSIILVALLAALLRETLRLWRMTGGNVGLPRGRRILAVGWALVMTSACLMIEFLLVRLLVGLWGPEPQLLAFYGRVFDLTSSVSPVIPLGLIIAVLALWSFCNLDRAYLMEVRGKPCEALDGATLTGFGAAHDSIQRVISDASSRSYLLLIPAILFVPFYRVVLDQLDTIDGSTWGTALKFLIIACYAVVAYSLTIFLALWSRLRRLLILIARHPLIEAFQRLPPEIATSPWRMWRTVPSLTTVQLSVAHLRLLANLRPRTLWGPFWREIGEDAKQAEAELEKILQSANLGFISTLALQVELKDILKKASLSILAQLQKGWKQWPGAPDPDKELRKVVSKEPFMDAATWLRLETPSEDEIWVHAAEEFLAIRMSAFIRYVFLQMKNLLSFALSGFILAVAAISSYPFQPQRPIMALTWVVGILSVTAVGIVIVSIDRDRVLSYIGKTAAGHVAFNHEFLTTMTLYVAVPLLALLATQFPGIGDFIYSVFTPAMKSAR
jgi:hypothetical protein